MKTPIAYDNQPIFILGSNRSGTSMLRAILTHHPEICIPPECHFSLWLHEEYSKWSESSDISGFIKDLYQCKKFESWGIDEGELLKFITEMKPKSYAELTSAVYCFYGLKKKSDSFRYWGDKNSLWIESLPVIRELYPDVKVIHLVRDGRDVACSYRELMKREIISEYAPDLPREISAIANKWNRDIQSVLEMMKELKEGNFYEIRYEDILNNSGEALSGLMAFLDLEYTEDMLKFHAIKKNPLAEPVGFLQWKEQLLQPINGSNQKKYLKELTSEEIAEFNEISAEYLCQYNYL